MKEKKWKPSQYQMKLENLRRQPELSPKQKIIVLAKIFEQIYSSYQIRVEGDGSIENPISIFFEMTTPATDLKETKYRLTYLFLLRAQRDLGIKKIHTDPSPEKISSFANSLSQERKLPPRRTSKLQFQLSI